MATLETLGLEIKELKALVKMLLPQPETPAQLTWRDRMKGKADAIEYLTRGRKNISSG